MAGCMSGYLSHVVHNMSTLKLMNPNKSYPVHISEYITKYESRVPQWVPASFKRTAAVLGRFYKYAYLQGSIILPAGVTIRTTQIVGSFIILNGTINAMQKYLL